MASQKMVLNNQRREPLYYRRVAEKRCYHGYISVSTLCICFSHYYSGTPVGHIDLAIVRRVKACLAKDFFVSLYECKAGRGGARR